jgi:ribosomal protein L25 (general stress protein Ctc)
MSDQIVLNAETRERTGSNKARVIRKVDGMVPAIVYGDEKESLNLKLHLNELTKASQNELFYTQVLLIKNGDLEEKVVLKELQRDPAKGKLLHADFQRASIRLTEIALPEGSEIPGLTEETDQMVVSVNAPKAVEEEPVIEEGEEGAAEEGAAEEGAAEEGAEESAAEDSAEGSEES